MPCSLTSLTINTVNRKFIINVTTAQPQTKRYWCNLRVINSIPWIIIIIIIIVIITIIISIITTKRFCERIIAAQMCVLKRLQQWTLANVMWQVHCGKLTHLKLVKHVWHKFLCIGIVIWIEVQKINDKGVAECAAGSFCRFCSFLLCVLDTLAELQGCHFSHLNLCVIHTCQSLLWLSTQQTQTG